MTELRELAGLELFSLGGTPVTVATLLTAALIVIFTFFVSSVLQRALARAFKMRGVKREGTVAVAKRLLHYAVLFVGLGVALDTLGVNLSALFAAGGFGSRWAPATEQTAARTQNQAGIFARLIVILRCPE